MGVYKTALVVKYLMPKAIGVTYLLCMYVTLPTMTVGANKKWNSFVQYQAKRWQEILRHWLIEGRETGRKVLVVHYEQLKQDRDVQLKRILSFLGIDMSFSLSEDDFGLFHRQHKKNFEPYTKKQKQYVLTVIINTIRELEQNHMKSETNLTQYLL